MRPVSDMRVLAGVVLLATCSVAGAFAQQSPTAGQDGKAVQGLYFAKKQYEPRPLARFSEARSQLPSPIFDEDPTYVPMYWKAWELAFRNFHEPAAGSGFVSPFIDAAFNQNIFLWDTCFMTMFCN